MAYRLLIEVRMNMKNLMLVLLLFSIMPTNVFAGANTSGGGGPETVDAGALKLLIDSGSLKRAMANYVQTVHVEQIEDALVRNKFAKMTAQNQLVSDIENSHYVVATPGTPCKDAYDNDVPASTIVGVLGSDICFNVEKLVHAYQGLSEEDVMVQFASLAFHEHTHHFQTFSKVLIKSNENEANRIAGYILITAKFVQLPLLKWTRPGSGPEEFQIIQSMYTAIKAKEQAFIAPSPADYSEYPDFQGKNDRGLVRLLPREKYDGKLSIGGGGAYFSFTKLSHEYQLNADIQLEQNNFSVGFAGCDFGFIVDLGNPPLSTVDEQHPALKYLMDFKPATHNEPEVRKQQRMAADGDVKANGYSYPSRTKNIQVGETFALRSIIFDQGGSDVLAVIKVVRIDEDGSIILAWKRLKTFALSYCN
jgi:hypothetical protein